jgi:hypothetical protein
VESALKLLENFDLWRRGLISAMRFIQTGFPRSRVGAGRGKTTAPA